MPDLNPSAYFNNVSDDRAIKAFDENPDGSLEGTTTISAETDRNDEYGTAVYLMENFAQFLTAIKSLPPQDRDNLLCYYCLHLPQAAVAALAHESQTKVSSLLRMSIKAISSRLLFGGGASSLEEVQAALERNGLPLAVPREDKDPVKIASLVLDYAAV